MAARLRCPIARGEPAKPKANESEHGRQKKKKKTTRQRDSSDVDDERRNVAAAKTTVKWIVDSA
eukprot:240860-Prymnesium_polylepis.1